MEEINDSIVIKSAETDEELCGRGYVHCTAWQESYRGIVCDRYLDTMTVEATTARARKFPDNTLVAKDGDKVVGFAVYSPYSRPFPNMQVNCPQNCDFMFQRSSRQTGI